jgi:hypothetical protein
MNTSRVRQIERWYACGYLVMAGAFMSLAPVQWLLGHPWYVLLNVGMALWTGMVGWKMIARHWSKASGLADARAKSGACSTCIDGKSRG